MLQLQIQISIIVYTIFSLMISLCNTYYGIYILHTYSMHSQLSVNCRWHMQAVFTTDMCMAGCVVTGSVSHTANVVLPVYRCVCCENKINN